VYVGTESDYYYFNFAEFARSTDSAVSFSAHNPGPFKAVSALAVDPHATANIYMSLQSDVAEHLRGFYSSNDGGTTWTRKGAGLPEGTVSSIVADPRTLGTLYAGTSDGVFRSFDAGANWAPFGSRLGLSVNSLAISGDGRFLHAGTDQGAFDLESVEGAVDVAAGVSGDSRLLVWDGKLTLSTLDTSGQWSAGTFSGSSTTWTATAIGVGTDGDSRVLWRCHDGRWGLEFIGPLRDQVVT